MKQFDKYWHYLRSVQSPDEDMHFVDRVYKDAQGAEVSPRILREDFCGTFANCCAWVKRHEVNEAHGVDLDEEPIGYGASEILPQLSESERKRVHIHKANVLGRSLPEADCICALNFSYFIFKERATLKQYFENCRRTLRDGGILVLDCFGGTLCQESNEDETEFEDLNFSYFWDQKTFDPLTYHAKFAIHFKRKGEKKRYDVFTYDWRMWTPAELSDLLTEVGFASVVKYWEGTTDDGEGDSNFSPADVGEECESWVTYIVARK